MNTEENKSVTLQMKNSVNQTKNKTEKWKASPIDRTKRKNTVLRLEDK